MHRELIRMSNAVQLKRQLILAGRIQQKIKHEVLDVT